MRIVSLIASATEMGHTLGLGDFQVGRSHECDHPSGHLLASGPRIVDSLRILAEVLYPEFEPTLQGIGWEKL